MNCAILTEYVVACELLDEEYDHAPFDLPIDDDDAYTYGRIGVHNVVVVCLPKGRYGTTSAASVARDMQRSFPAIRVGMMVGIGGGAPTGKHDIRPGDVVVSTPVRRTGGVIRYDFGKTIQNRKFEPTGSLNKPPSILLNALLKLSARHHTAAILAPTAKVGEQTYNGGIASSYSSPGARKPSTTPRLLRPSLKRF